MSARHSATGPATLLAIAKKPAPTRVRTRLTPPRTSREAAALAEAGLADTPQTVLEGPARRRGLVPDSAPGSWLPPGFDIVPPGAASVPTSCRMSPTPRGGS